MIVLGLVVVSVNVTTIPALAGDVVAVAVSVSSAITEYELKVSSIVALDQVGVWIHKFADPEV